MAKREIKTFGFDSSLQSRDKNEDPTVGREVPTKEGQGLWEGPRGVIKYFYWSKTFTGYLRTLRTRYNGITGILDPSQTWNRRDMASIAWYMSLMADHLDKMADKTRKMSLEMGEYHGYLPPDLPEELGPFATMEEAKQAITEINADVLRDPEGTVWKGIMDLEVARGEERRG